MINFEKIIKDDEFLIKLDISNFKDMNLRIKEYVLAQKHKFESIRPLESLVRELARFTDDYNKKKIIYDDMMVEISREMRDLETEINNINLYGNKRNDKLMIRRNYLIKKYNDNRNVVLSFKKQIDDEFTNSMNKIIVDFSDSIKYLYNFRRMNNNELDAFTEYNEIVHGRKNELDELKNNLNDWLNNHEQIALPN